MPRPYRRRRPPSPGRWPALRRTAGVALPLLVGLGAALVGVALGPWPGLARAVFEVLDSATGLAVLFLCGLLGRLALPLTYPAPRTARASSARLPRGFAAR